MSMRSELAASGIKVVVIRPGPVDTPFRANAARAPGETGYDAPDPKAQRARPGTGAAAAGRGVAPGTGGIASGTNGTAPGSSAVLSSSARFDYDNDPFLRTPEDCWFDPVIR